MLADLSSSGPLKTALMVSVKATANGIVSAFPTVSGLGPRDGPYNMDVVLNDEDEIV